MEALAMKPHAIERFAVDSSALRSIGYQNGVCVVETTNGHLYAYQMDHAEFEKFALAPSKGQYFSTSVKGRYPSTKLTSRCGRCGSEPELVGEPCASCGCEIIRAIDRIHAPSVI